MNIENAKVERVIGLDSHPDTFTAAIVQGPTPAAAVVQKVFNKVPLETLESWALKHTTPEDIFVLEASGNSFHVVRVLRQAKRNALVLESCHLGKLKEAHANNDKISAVRIGKAYLAGTAKPVWVPDWETQLRRDVYHGHRKAVKRVNQLRSRLSSYLSDNGVRLAKGDRLTDPKIAEKLETARTWWKTQWYLIEGHLTELRQAEEQRKSLRSFIAQQVLQDPVLLSLVRLCGIRDLIAFALGALVGDINRFANPKKLVAYIGLNPAFDDSGNTKWSGGISGHGRKDLRALLIEAAHAILRSPNNPWARWGKKLLARKGSLNLAVAAVARRLTVAIWYLMMGRWTPLEEVDDKLSAKVGKIITAVGMTGLKQLGKVRKQLREEVCQTLKTGREYILNPDKKFVPEPVPEPAAIT
jgi:transposase